MTCCPPGRGCCAPSPAGRTPCACFQVEAAHFNHGLRGDEAQRDEEFVRAQCVRWQVPLTVGRGDVGDFARREGQTIEEAARTLRYAFL